VGLIPDAFVITSEDLRLGIFQAGYNFGERSRFGGPAHPGEVKLVHWFPPSFYWAVIFIAGCTR